MKIKQIAIYSGLALAGLYIWGRVVKPARPKVNFEDVTTSRQYGGLSTTPYKPMSKPNYTVLKGANGQPVLIDQSKSVFA